MRKSLVILFSLLLMSACVHRPTSAVRSLMEEAEGMMRTCPDTAYFLLREMGASMDLSSDADRAYHGLLLMEAQVKNRMKLTDTAALQELADYYKTQPDSLVQARLLRLRAVVHRDGGRYEEAVRCYDVAIDEARRIGDRLLLVDGWLELARVYASEGEHLLADSVFLMAEKAAEEWKDTALWIDNLLAHANSQSQYAETEHLWLKMLDLADASHNKKAQYTASFRLSMDYAEVGEKEKSLSYAKRYLKVGEDSLSKHDYYLKLGVAYQRIGEKDSAEFYFAKSRMYSDAKEPVIVSSSSRVEAGNRNMARLFVDRIKQKEELERQQMQKRYLSVSLVVLLVVGVIASWMYIKRSRIRHRQEEELRLVTEALCKALDEEKRRLFGEYIQTKEQLQRKETELQAEKEALQRKEREVSDLQQRLDSLSSDTIRVFDKIKQIIADYCYKNKSELKMEEPDWKQLQWVMDKQWEGAIARIQEKYRLTDAEIHLFCLNLTDIPTAHISYLFDRARDYAYAKTRALLEKLGIERGSKTYKDALVNFIKNQE